MRPSFFKQSVQRNQQQIRHRQQQNINNAGGWVQHQNQKLAQTRREGSHEHGFVGEQRGSSHSRGWALVGGILKFLAYLVILGIGAAVAISILSK